MNETEEEAAKKLYEACLSGSVETLEKLIRDDHLILQRVNLTEYFFNYTPLHVAVFCGHLDFTKVLLKEKQKFATELDLRLCSPLHLASAEGHLEIVRELLRANTDVCTIRDREGRTPLHLAVMKGRVEVIQELLRVKPRSVRDKLGNRENVLHLSVKNDRLEVLKTLVAHLVNNDMESLLNSIDNDGNTILYLAAALKQIDTVEYLLGIESVKDHANDKNQNGWTALDVVEHFPNKDLKTITIREFLLEAGVHKSVWRRPEPNYEYSPPNILPNPPPPPSRKLGVKILLCICWYWISFIRVDSHWLREVRGYLIIAATLMATMAYQSILSPPGGVWQETKGGQNAASPAPSPSLGNTADDKHIGGQAAMASNADGLYGNYLVLNTIVLGASLSAIMLAMTGFPMNNRFLSWLLVFTVYISISCMGAAYVIAINLVSPAQLSDDALKALWLGWTCIWAFIMVLHSCHFLVWLVKKLTKLVKICYICCKPTPRAYGIRRIP